MKKVESQFRICFQRWGIVLPPEDVAMRRAGYIAEKGWSISYVFGSDVKGEYLDFYASHRMTNDRHVRIYADGTMDTSLSARHDMRMCSDDPDEDRRLEDEHRQHNKHVLKSLRNKGLRP